MLVREVMEPIGDGSDGYRWASVHLKSNYSTLFLEVTRDTGYDMWLLPGWIETLHGCGCSHAGEKLLLQNAEEFETQMLLDHYTNEFGVVRK